MEKPIRLTREQIDTMTPMPGQLVVRINGRPGIQDSPILLAGAERRSKAESSYEGTITAVGPDVTLPVGTRVWYRRNRPGVAGGTNFDGPADERYIFLTPKHIGMIEADGELKPYGDRALVRQHGQTTFLRLPDKSRLRHNGMGEVLAMSDDFGGERVSTGDVVVFDPFAGEELAVRGSEYRLLESKDIGGVMVGA